jgi:type VI secretion system protein ImpG
LTEVERRTRQHPDYLGSDCHIALVDEASAPFRTRFHGDGASAIRRLRITAECTNRHLATGMGRQFDVEGIPVQAIEILGQPTLPRSSPAEGEFAWRLIAHLGLSHQALVAGPGPGVAALRRMLELHTPPGEVRQPEIESLRSLASRVIMRRVRTQGPVPFAFARGLEITAEFDEKAAGAPGVFLFGAVLERFLSRYVSVNSFTETTIRTRQGDLKKWPARSGTRLIC